MEAIKNLTIVTVSTGYDSSATSIALSSGHGALLPDPATDGQFRVTWYNSSDYSNPADDPDAEIVLITARSTDTLTITRPASGNSYLGEGSDNTASNHNTGGKTYKMVLAPTKKIFTDIMTAGKENLLKNGNFWNNSTNGYGSTPDDWTNSSANPVQGGFPTMTKQQLIDITGISDGDIEGLWNLNEASGNAIDLSSNGYELTETSGTIAADSDGLMATARDFEAGDTEYFTRASANSANLHITGSQTWFAYIKIESIDASGNCIFSVGTTAGGSKEKRLFILSTANIYFQLFGLTTASSISSDVAVEVGKWYFICGVYDSANSKLKIWVNGVKKETTASGTVDNNWNDTRIGVNESVSSNYYDGLIQTVGILSVALSDTQVKKLWAYTTWKGMKVRRATSDGYIYQSLDPAEVERLRGRTLTLRAMGYKDTAGTDALISIYDGSTETESADLTGASAWESMHVTKTISATASEITIRLKAKTTDGNVWYKEVALFEGSFPFAFEPSKNDVTRLPRLLRMDIPEYARIKPYQYEEGRVFAWTPVVTNGSGVVYSVQQGTVVLRGKELSFNCYLGYLTQTGTSGDITIGMPVYCRSGVSEIDFCGRFLFYTGTTGIAGNYYMSDNGVVAYVRGATYYTNRVWENKIYYMQFGGIIPIY